MFMSKIIISKKEYRQLKDRSEAYKKGASAFFSSVIRKPITEVVEDFKNTGLYSKRFIADLEKGLKRSSYAK